MGSSSRRRRSWDGTVYIGDEAGTVYAIDSADGEAIWSVPTGEQIRTDPQVVGGSVYVGSTDNSVYAFDAEDGTELWTFETGSFVNSSPTRVGRTVYVASEDTTLYAIDAVQGTEIWRFEGAAGPITNAPTVVDGVVYVGSRDERVYAVDADDGTLVWEYPTGLWVSSEVTVVDGIAYVGSDDSTLYALDAADGTLEWAFTEPRAHLISATTVHEGTVHIGTDDETSGRIDGPTEAVLYAVDADSGDVQWAFEVPVPDDTSEDWQFHAAPTVADGVVYIGNVNGTVYGIDVDTGDAVWYFETDDAVWSSPTVADGVLYVGSDDGHLYALDLETSASSEDSRVALGTLGHTDEWSERASPEELSAAIWAERTELEPGESVSISGSPSQGEITAYEWSAPQADGFPESGESIEHTFEEAGRYAVTLTVSGPDGEANLGPMVFVVGDAPEEDLSASIWAETTEPEPGEPVSISGSPSQGEITAYEWSAPEAAGFPESGESIEYTFEEAGRYAVTLTVTGVDGETHSGTMSFDVGDVPDAGGDPEEPDDTGAGDEGPGNTGADDEGPGNTGADDEEPAEEPTDDETADDDGDDANGAGGDDGGVTDAVPGMGLVSTLTTLGGLGYLLARRTDAPEGDD